MELFKDLSLLDFNKREKPKVVWGRTVHWAIGFFEGWVWTLLVHVCFESSCKRSAFAQVRLPGFDDQ